jgi:hypothetical protein
MILNEVMLLQFQSQLFYLSIMVLLVIVMFWPLSMAKRSYQVS